MSADPGFVHLHVHSAYSLLEGAMTIGKLAEFAKADKQPALALTDTDNMFGGLEFSEKLAGSGIQPIAAVSLAIGTTGGGRFSLDHAVGLHLGAAAAIIVTFGIGFIAPMLQLAVSYRPAAR